MSSPNNIQMSENEIKESQCRANQKETIKSYIKNEEEKNQNTEKTNGISLKPIHILLIVLGAILIVALVIVISVIVVKNNNEYIRRFKSNSIRENSYVKAEVYDDLTIPSDGKLQVVGGDFPHKSNILIRGVKKNFTVNENGKIENITKADFPIYLVFNETIKNGSYLFKDVSCFKSIDLSKMDSSKMIDASNMFENSNFEEIFFGNDSRANTRNLEENSENVIDEEITEESEIEERKSYFDTSKIQSASELFKNCRKLKKVQLSPSFNVGKSAKGMFKGCSALEEVNTTFISSTEVEEMESMFEDCKSLKEISFSNDFLTGEIKTLKNVFKNTNLITLDISYLRLYSLESSSNIFDGASIKGTLKIGKHYSNDAARDNLFKEIAKVTDASTNICTPSGSDVNQVFEEIYYEETNVRINVNIIDIDYNIHYKKNEKYKLYMTFLHVGLGWDYDASNRYDLDSSIVTFDYRLKYLDRVNFQQMVAYNGVINLNGDDVTGEGEGDDEEINVTLNELPPDVKLFTVQLNSYTRNSLEFVRSAYIRLSTESEVIGTYDIAKAGDNIGLLIGCFSKSDDNEWYFRPLNKFIPGQIVTESISSIRTILAPIFGVDKLMITAEELVNSLMVVANGLSVYSQEPKFNSLYWNGTHWFADCSNLIKSIINGRDVYNPEIGSYQKTFPIVEDVNANGLILKCNNTSNDFSKLQYGVPRLLHLKDNNGNGHVGIYLGRTNYIYNQNENNTEIVNVIESTTSWRANGVIYSWVDSDGTRRLYKEGPLSENKYNWTSHGGLENWILY